MPRGDRTGPAGMGPMTGRGAGFCAGYQVPGYANPVGDRGMGYGFGGGRGRGGGGWGRGGGWGQRNMYGATGVPGWQPFHAGYPAYGAAVANNPAAQGQELDVLKDQAEYFESALNEIKSRISELESKSKDK